MTRKFISGMALYAQLWDGPVRALLNVVPGSPALDNVEVDPSDLPFQAIPVSFERQDFYPHLQGVAVALGGPHYQLHGWVKRALAMGVQPVSCVEYSLQTRLDIARAEGASTFQIAKRSAWEIREEVRNLRDLSRSAAIQCNGTPTYDTYHHINSNTLLYFDTRVSESDYATQEHTHNRLHRYFSGAPLHLAFSGRWIRMKGVHHLTDMAQELSCRKVPYKFSICGGGDLETYLRGEIQRLQLKDVQLLGNLNFTKELLPLMREQVDLFVAPHIQGDPACTYLETLACGVPIVGYANEAWSGILNRAPVGWSAPVGDPKALARVIASLEKSELAERSLAALQFAKAHSFERTYEARVQHLASCTRS